MTYKHPKTSYIIHKPTKMKPKSKGIEIKFTPVKIPNNLKYATIEKHLRLFRPFNGMIPLLYAASNKFIVNPMYIKVVEMKKGPQSLTSFLSDKFGKMYSVEQVSRLFRPWDMCDKACEDDRRKEEKRESRLRKIRGTFKKDVNLHQDATVSTTTNDDVKTIDEPSPVTSLTLCCDRLLQEPTVDKEPIKLKESSELHKKPKELSNQDFPPAPINASNIYNSTYVPDYIPTDVAQALGVPPTDPLFLESIAQGYAMELEYARILHQENEAKLLNARKQRPKKYKCPHCQVGFSNNGQLKGHIRIHTGERPYKCEETNCGKTFTRNEELTRHKRIHSGVRPFPCPTCGKKFGRRDHLKKHTRTHFMNAERMMPVFVPLSAMPHIAGFPYLYGY